MRTDTNYTLPSQIRHKDLAVDARVKSGMSALEKASPEKSGIL